MVEVYLPYLLLLLTWNDLDPGATMNNSQALYIDKSTCMLAGEERLQLITADRLYRLEKFKVEQIRTENAKFLCIPHQTEIEKYPPLTEKK